MTQAEMNEQISMIRNRWWSGSKGQEALPWSEAVHWPQLLAEIVAHGYFAVRLCYFAPDGTWWVETEAEIASPVVMWPPLGPNPVDDEPHQTSPGGAVCLAWLRWMFEEKGIGVVDGLVVGKQAVAP